MRTSVVLAALFACSGGSTLRLVDPFTGTAGGDSSKPISAGPGNTFPGAVVPWGMVSVSPHNDRSAPAGYRRGAPAFYGFGHVHLSGVGCPALGHVVVAATTGELAFDDDQRGSPYSDEAAAPGWYHVRLARYAITADATATRRTGLSRFVFPARTGDANVLVDAGAGAEHSSARVVSTSEIEGKVTAGGFCDQHDEHTLYFVARTSKPAISTGTWRDGAYLRFTTAHGEPIEVAVGVSYVDLDGARRNLDRELDWDFTRVRRRAEEAWQHALGRIEVDGGTAEQQTVFETALYHSLLHPNVFSDVDGRFTGGDRRVHAATGRDRYSVFSLWDTYRTLHPLLSLVWPDVQREMARTLVDLARELGHMPRWELAGADTGVMVGDPGAIVLADTYVRGVRDFGVEAAYPSLLAQAITFASARPGQVAFLHHGFIPHDDTAGDWVFGTVATSLEYDLADAALAALASTLGHDRDAARLRALSLGDRALFDPAARHVRPRNADGSWLAPFDPAATCCDKPWPESGGPGFVEGSAWTYDFFALHDVDDLIARYGGPRELVARLDEMFAGGHFALGNEPDFATPYLYALAGRSDRSATLVRALVARFRDAPDGLPGNDDAGALSAWLVWSALGLYPVIPGVPRYWIGSPLFARATLHLAGGRFTIIADDNAPDHPYVQSAQLDGRPLERPYLDHAELTRGGTLRLRMGPRPGPPPWGPAR
jgi:predicted alpha-1,2-mannosidase